MKNEIILFSFSLSVLDAIDVLMKVPAQTELLTNPCRIGVT